MTNEGINSLIQILRAKYPEWKSTRLDQLDKWNAEIKSAFKNHTDSEVFAVAQRWIDKNTDSCTIEDLKIMLDGFEKITPDEEKFRRYFENSEGYGYLLSIKEADCICIWKPQWAYDRTITVPYWWKGTTTDGHKAGDRVFVPKKDKKKVLASYGITLS